MKTREQILKEKYGFDKGSYKYVPRGSEILKYQGQVVLHVWYKKKEDGTAATKKCPYCVSVIDIAAKRCPNCTTILDEELQKELNEAAK